MTRISDETFLASFTPKAVAKNLVLQESSEWQQGVIRTIIAGLVVLYLSLDYLISGWSADRHDDRLTLAIVAAYFLFSLSLMAFFKTWTTNRTPLRSITLSSDLAMTTYAAYLAGELLAPFFAIYMWIILGYGIRYGQRFLVASTVLGAIGFGSVILRMIFG